MRATEIHPAIRPPNAAAVSKLLREFGQYIALPPGNPYRAKAHTRAADNLLTMTQPLEEVIAQDQLPEIPGVGTPIADMIKEMHATGTHPALERMRAKMPAGVIEMLSIPGLRPDAHILDRAVLDREPRRARNVERVQHQH